jgi:hypothetical protein
MRAIVPWMAMAWALLLVPATALGESSDGNRLPLTSLEAFEGSSEAWTVASRVYADRPGGDLEVEPGKGVLLFEGAEPATLRSRAQHGDVRLEAEFMMGPGASAALLLQDRYELRLTTDQPGYPPGRRDHGAIVYGESQGVPSRLDASRVAGVWQRLVVEFEAPQFDEDGGKRDNARLKRVVLNGTTIHRAVEAPRPSPNAERAEEAKTGPIALRGVEGRIAFRKIRYAPLPADQSGPRSVAGASGGREVGDPPMLLAPVERPVIQRGYVDHREGMRIDGAFVGDPARVHYCIDLAQGALLHAWRGPFLDMAPVWTGRGMDADRVVDRPRIRGSRITFSGRPTAACHWSMPSSERNWAADTPCCRPVRASTAPCWSSTATASSSPVPSAT